MNTIVTGNTTDTAAGSIDFGLVEAIAHTPGLLHRLAECNLKDSTFTLENRSKWAATNIEMIKNWKEEDDLLITQNQALISAHRFAVVNPRLQKAVPISLLREPLPVEGKTFFILNIDPLNDIVALSNGKEYSISSQDHGTLRKFSENDRVILGFNASDRFDVTNPDYFKGYLLINTTCNSYIRASLVQ